MRVFTYTVKDPEGIHALPAGGLIKLAGTFSCSVTAQGNGGSVDLKSDTCHAPFSIEESCLAWGVSRALLPFLLCVLWGELGWQGGGALS